MFLETYYYWSFLPKREEGLLLRRGRPVLSKIVRVELLSYLSPAKHYIEIIQKEILGQVNPSLKKKIKKSITFSGPKPDMPQNPVS